MNLQINKVYQNLVPEIPIQEYESFKCDIKERGLLIPIIVNSQGIILDGHHRYRACKELDIDCKYEVRDFENQLLEQSFVNRINLNRRHLNHFQRAELALKEKAILEKIAKLNESLGGKGVEIQTPLGRVDQEIGKLAGIGKDTVRKVETILKIAPVELLDKARKGQWKINKVYKKLQHEQKRQELVTGAIELQKSSNENQSQSQNIQLFQGDFNELTKQLPDNSIDLIFTDPLYDEGSLHLYEKLAAAASRILRPGSSIVFIVGHGIIPQVINYFENAGLQYHWILAVKLQGSFPRAFDRKVVIKHKPLLWFRKGDKSKINMVDYIEDFIESKRPEKLTHEMEQSPIEAGHVISRLTVENQIVLDPMMGSGTTGIACKKLNRKFIGIEIDPQRFEVAKANLAS
jgi:ParB-like chromosome segregation protein Spo0J